MKNIWEPDGVGSPEPGCGDKIKYQQTSTKPCNPTDLETDGLYHVRKLTNISFTSVHVPRLTNIKLSKLSKINRDKFFLCRELLRNPSVIFFDQSSIHQQTESLLRNLKQISNLGKTVVCTLEMASFRLVPLLKTKINNVYMHIYLSGRYNSSTKYYYFPKEGLFTPVILQVSHRREEWVIA